MQTKKEIKEALLSSENGEEVYFNMVHDGGAMAIRVNYDWFVLFEIPLYGGTGMLDKIYHKSQIDSLINTALSWT